MHPLARVVAVAYLVLAAVASVVLVQTGTNYVQVTEIQVNIGGHVGVTEIQVVWNRSVGTEPIVKVFLTATNPGRIAIEITNVDFHLHMDDPGDGYAWDDVTGLALTAIRPGGYTTAAGRGIVVPPGESRVVEAIVPIQGADQIERFDRPDAAGRYHPVVWNLLFVYAFVGFDLHASLFLPPYYAVEGVPAIG